MNQTQSINPMIFIPSPRDIPDVMKWWPKMPHDKFIVKYKNQPTAYKEGKEYFLEHEQYTHFIICPDDLEVPPAKLKILINDVKCSGYRTISGFSNIDETQLETYCFQPLGLDLTTDHPSVNKGSWYMENEKPIKPKDVDILQVGHSGFSCQVIERDLLDKVSWIGASGNGWHNFDWQFSKDCHKLGVPIYVDLRVKMYHRRKEQYHQAKAVKNKAFPKEGYSFLLK